VADLDPVTSDESGAASGARAQRLILRGGGSAAIGLVIRFGARLLFVFVAARLFGAALFGAYSLAVALVELGVAVGGLGMKRLLFKLLDEDRSGRPPVHVLLDSAAVVAAASLGLAALLMIAAALAPLYGAGGATAGALLLVAPMIAGQALLDLFLAATRWKHRMRYEVTARSIVEPYAALAILLAAWAAGLRETGLLLAYWAGTLAALVYAAAGARRCFGSFALRGYRMARGGIRAVLREAALPTLTDVTSALFGRIDLYLVGLLLGEGPAGIYNVARQVRTPIRQVRQSFDGLLTPIVARTLALRGPAETGLAVASASRLILAIQLPMLVGLAAIGLPLLRWFGPEFAAGYWALVFVAGAETIQGAFGVSDLIFLYRRPAIALRITMVTTAVNVAAGWLLIPRFGVDGAGLAVLAAIGAGALIRRMSLRAHFGIRIPLSYSGGPMICAVAAMAAAAAAAYAAAPASEVALAAIALAVALSSYAAALILWIRASGVTLGLAEFRTD
jgi:O-antigen/teichoic acid export membrane protein